MLCWAIGKEQPSIGTDAHHVSNEHRRAQIGHEPAHGALLLCVEAVWQYVKVCCDSLAVGLQRMLST